MRKWQKVMEAAAVLAMLSLAACSSGGGDSPSAAPASVSGQVADGYLRGATVCLDVNGDKKCDAGEPTATSGAGGVFTIAAEELAKLNGADPALHPIVVEVVEGAIDEDTITVDNPAGTPITAPYILSAPAGKPEFVSPITTLVQSQIESNPGLSVEEAEAAVKTQLDVSEDVSLFENYIEPENQAKAAELETMHRVAQVVASTMADMQGQIGQAIGTTQLQQDYGAIAKLVMEEVMNRLITIADTVKTSGETFNLETAKATLIEKTGTVDTGTITRRIEEMKTVVAKSSFLTMLEGDGVFWIDMWNDSYMTEFEYGNVKADAQGNPVDDHYFRPAGGEWTQETEPESPDFLLTANGWVEYGEDASNYSVVQGADGNILLTHKITGVQEKLVAVEYDLTGKAHGMFAGEVMSKLISETAVFPTGAKGYKLTFIPQQEIYSVETWTDDREPDVDQNYVRYQEQYNEVPVTTLESMLTLFSPDAKRYMSVAGEGDHGLVVQFGAGGQLLLFKTSYMQGPSTAEQLKRADNSIVTGTWSEATAHGVKIVKLNIPDIVKGMFDVEGIPFYVVKGEQVKQGRYIAAGTVGHDDEINFNKTAFDSLVGNINFTYTPGGGYMGGGTSGPSMLALRR